MSISKVIMSPSMVSYSKRKIHFLSYSSPIMLALSINTQRTPQELISSHIWVPPKKHATYQGPKLNPWEPKQVHTLIGSPSMKYLLASGYNLCRTASTSFPSSEMGLVFSEVNQHMWKKLSKSYITILRFFSHRSRLQAYVTHEQKFLQSSNLSGWGQISFCYVPTTKNPYLHMLLQIHEWWTMTRYYSKAPNSQNPPRTINHCMFARLQTKLQNIMLVALPCQI